MLYLGPITVIGFSLCLYLNSYICMCIGYMFLGFTKGKTTICLLYANEQIQSQHAPIASSVVYFLDSGCTALFCLWMLFVNRDAISYLQFVNIYSIVFMVYLTFFTVESPKWHINKNMKSHALKGLNYAKRFNSVIKCPKKTKKSDDQIYDLMNQSFESSKKELDENSLILMT